MLLHYVVDMKKVFLGPLESAIMEIVWTHDAVSVRDVVEALKKPGSAGKKTAYTTAMTVMNRLVEKKILTRKQHEGNAFVYRAVKGKQAFQADASKRVIDNLVAECGTVALAQFVDRLGKVDPELKARLKKLIDEEGS